MKNIARRALLALQFLTRIPIHVDLRPQESDIAGSSVFYPLAGLIIGGFGCISAYLGSHLGIPLLAGMLTVLAMTAANGALHLDGFADCCDAVFSTRSRETMLEIMKDSRLGTMGSIGVVADFVLKAVLIVRATPLDYLSYGVILLCPVVGKACIAVVALIGHSAKADGLGTIVVEGMRPFFTVINIFLAIALPILWSRDILWGAAAAVSICGSVLLMVYFQKRIGGITGDCLGAANELGEILFLISICLILQMGV